MMPSKKRSVITRDRHLRRKKNSIRPFLATIIAALLLLLLVTSLSHRLRGAHAFPLEERGDEEEQDIISLQIPHNACDLDGDCYNGGTCVHSVFAVDSKDFKPSSCRCPRGFTGFRCELVCPCQNGATCRSDAPGDDPSSPQCDCSAAASAHDRRFEGVHCEIVVHICPGGELECQYGGSCVGDELDDRGNPSTYRCDCPIHRDGPSCEIAIKLAQTSTSSDDETPSRPSPMSEKNQSGLSRGGKATISLAVIMLAGVALIALVVYKTRIDREKLMEETKELSP